MKKLFLKQKFKPMGAGATLLNGLSMEGTLVDIKGELNKGGMLGGMLGGMTPKIAVTA